MRFTTSKEAGNPNAHFIHGLINAFDIIGKKALEVFLQFRCDHIFFQFLLFIFFFILSNFDYTIDPPINRF